MSDKVKCTVRVVLPMEIACYAEVSVWTTKESSESRKEMVKLFATQLKLWATGACADEVVTLCPVDDYTETYKEHIEEAFEQRHPKKSIDMTIKLMKEDVQCLGDWEVEGAST